MPSHDPLCIEALSAIADGELARWRGLPACTVADATAALGGEVSSGHGELGRWAQYSGRSSAPQGVTLWFRDQHIALVEIFLPALQRSVRDQLGEPEATVDSYLGDALEQWIYSSRGLTAHVEPWNGKATHVFGYPSMTVAEFLGSAWRNVRVIKDPARD